jgi:peroxiredoxin
MSFTFILVSVLTTSFIQENKNEYRIVGTASGLEDNTVLYLEYKSSEGNKGLDSAYIIDEKFSFTGELKLKVVNALIRTRNFSDYRFFWLENSVISFKAEKGKFQDAIIRGSETQNEENELNAILKTTEKGQEKAQYISFVDSHSNSIVSANLLSVYASTWGRETATTLYKKLSDEIKNTSYAKNVLEFISLNKDLKIGDKYADFSQEDTQQKLVSLSDYNGKIVLLEFWGSWCGPCRKENPELVKMYDEFKDKGFEILGVAAETSKNAWMKAIETDKLTWTNVTDFRGDKNKAALIYGVSYYPTNFLIDRTGTIISRDLKGDKLREKLKEILLTD